MGEGNQQAEIMLIAQAPGELEDKADKMFIGPSGKMLDKLLNSACIQKEQIYMTNLIKCNLPHNRRPKQKEIWTCCRYLEIEIEEICPQLLVPLGYYPTKYLFERYKISTFSKREFHDLIGKLFTVQELKIFPVSHPASLLYHPEFLEKSISNFKKIKELGGKYEHI